MGESLIWSGLCPDYHTVNPEGGRWAAEPPVLALSVALKANGPLGSNYRKQRPLVSELCETNVRLE